MHADVPKTKHARPRGVLAAMGSRGALRGWRWIRGECWSRGQCGKCGSHTGPAAAASLHSALQALHPGRQPPRLEPAQRGCGVRSPVLRRARRCAAPSPSRTQARARARPARARLPAPTCPPPQRSGAPRASRGAEPRGSPAADYGRPRRLARITVLTQVRRESSSSPRPPSPAALGGLACSGSRVFLRARSATCDF